jgi:hypothetical protein
VHTARSRDSNRKNHGGEPRRRRRCRVCRSNKTRERERVIAIVETSDKTLTSETWGGPPFPKRRRETPPPSSRPIRPSSSSSSRVRTTAVPLRSTPPCRRPSSSKPFAVTKISLIFREFFRSHGQRHEAPFHRFWKKTSSFFVCQGRFCLIEAPEPTPREKIRLVFATSTYCRRNGIFDRRSEVMSSLLFVDVGEMEKSS